MYKHIPTQTGSATNWALISAGGNHSMALKSDGTLWGTGYNINGQVGDGTTWIRKIHIQERTRATNWTAIATGSRHSLALKSDGTLWGWGSNQGGQLGDDASNRSTPTQIGSETNWALISAGNSHSIALKSDGTLWGWGENLFGQLGDGTTSSNRTTPTQEATGATNWTAISGGGSHSMALKSDGTLWAWGKNQFGQVGDGTTSSNRSTPTQEATGATNWTAISAGHEFTVALKSDGTLWAWGNSSYGQLGDGTILPNLTHTYRSTPTQEATGATNWALISAGGKHSMALKSDGTLWGWGRNSGGQLGDGTTTDISTPTQEATGATNWTAIAAGWYFTVAIK